MQKKNNLIRSTSKNNRKDDIRYGSKKRNFT